MDLFDDLMGVHARAAADDEYEVAYHCLMAALHLADHRGDFDAVDRVDAAVKKIGTAIETMSPPHLLSRANAQKRGQQSLADSMGAHVQAVRARLHADQARAGRPLPPSG